MISSIVSKQILLNQSEFSHCLIINDALIAKCTTITCDAEDEDTVNMNMETNNPYANLMHMILSKTSSGEADGKHDKIGSFQNLTVDHHAQFYKINAVVQKIF